jgi:squalene-hopene/tetraprenyl-beta-curcumene cyclase
MEKDLLRSQLKTLNERLLKEQNEDGFWTGKLSSSALSTATAIVALKINGNPDDNSMIELGFNWLCLNNNSDGGFGDTPESESNVSTSLLSYAAISYCKKSDHKGLDKLNEIEKFLETRGIKFYDSNITASILEFYGSDYTFSVPILSMLVICGVLDKEAVNYIPRLPFELSLLPAKYYRFFNLQVVSYAIPALIGVGIYIHTSRKPGFSAGNIYRNRCIGPSIGKLISIMPESGGFLEAIPLTAFVSMCLTASKNNDNEVVKRGISFLKNQQRTDGSWPIDTDLSTWVTTLSIKAFGPQLKSVLSGDKIQKVKMHLLSIQNKEKHPFNGAEPGGWGWTNFSGSVPDADDTPGAILALLEMYEDKVEEKEAILNGCKWLIGIQNSDGGFPTFCKGWGKLPFDRSSADLTGHVLLALIASKSILKNEIPEHLQGKLDRSVLKAIGFLKKHQSIDGYWLALWFGNQHTSDKKNPVYGTAKVCVYLIDCLKYASDVQNLRGMDIRFYVPTITEMIRSAQKYLLSQQNGDGSWGGGKDIPGTVEETSLAISALATDYADVCLKGFEWLMKNSDISKLKSSAIGLYFAMLWYDEKLYPLTAYCEALRRFLT